eukprot:CAMPEP_0113244900 /NCGR_PEP_ID=MMETSP0008_2-20120614/8649_1 /TAXON_ID=97485 /ORGANISM="Prymnesium parvum" /LENGTH=556 /DNA_ID=CAMNT_0000092551 /DNA_START=94 /DNA_END=1764 /DNA_ORIENTATION=+ /assembly_acc=CAM_ASM_000153
MHLMQTLANCATDAADAMSVSCDICGRKLANSGAMKSHRRACERKASEGTSDSRKRRCNGKGALLDWEMEEQLPPPLVDAKLWPGAAEQGWRVVPKYRGAAAKSHWCYYTPGGTRLASKSLAFAASTKLDDESQLLLRPAASLNGPTEAEILARQAAEREGLTLVVSRRSGTGYKCVVYNTAYRRKPFNVQVRESGRTIRLGAFETAIEAALCYSRHLGRDGSAAAMIAEERAAHNEEAVAYEQSTPAPTTEEVLRQAAAEGLNLVRARTQTGFKGVRKIAHSANCKRPFRAKASRLSAKTHGHLGDFATAAEASLCYTRYHAAMAAEASTAVGSAADALYALGGPETDSSDEEYSSSEEVQDFAPPLRPPLTAMGAQPVSRPPFTAMGGETLSRPPFTAMGGETLSRPPFTAMGGETLSRAPFTAMGASRNGSASAAMCALTARSFPPTIGGVMHFNGPLQPIFNARRAYAYNPLEGRGAPSCNVRASALLGTHAHHSGRLPSGFEVMAGVVDDAADDVVDDMAHPVLNGHSVLRSHTGTSAFSAPNAKPVMHWP